MPVITSQSSRWHISMSYFNPTNSPKLNKIQFIILYDKEKLKILALEKLERLAQAWPFCLNNTLQIHFLQIDQCRVSAEFLKLIIRLLKSFLVPHRLKFNSCLTVIPVKVWKMSLLVFIVFFNLFVSTVQMD